MQENAKYALATYQKKRISDDKLTRAAVLIPIFCVDGRAHILFTKRSNQVPYHKGQVAFPGGAYNQLDSSLMDTALRENCEEIGLAARDVEILGELDDIVTTTGFIVSPFVAHIPNNSTFKRSEGEIDEIFSVPLSALLENPKFKEEHQLVNGVTTTVYYYEYDKWVIWGATARILKQLLEILGSTSGAQC